MATAEFTADSLARALQGVSDEIQREVSALIDVAAQTAKGRVQQAYPVGPPRKGRPSGTLRRRVFVTQPRSFTTSGFGVPIPIKQVKATAPHVWIYQEGTVERFDQTRKNARRGRSPRHGRIFEAIAAKTRAEMLAKAEQIISRPRPIE